MLNQNQINKLMRKAGRKVEEKFDKIEREQKLRHEQQRREREEQLVFITNQIKKNENENPKRGSCVCVWKNMSYAVKKTTTLKNSVEDKVIVASLPVNDVRNTLDLLETIGDKQFYMFPEALFEETKKSMDWMANHYAQIKIALGFIKDEKRSAEDKLVQMLSLGTVFEEFQKEFPGKSMFFFRECMLAFDKMFQEECNSIKQEEE